MANKLYYGSLEKHMKEYMKGVDLQNQNNQYQLAQAQIVKEGEAMQLSRAEIQNKIEMMKQTLKDSIAQKLLPSEKVAQVAQVAQDQYKPMTASEYENKISKKPTVKVENRRGLIDELKEKLQKRKQTQMITEIFPEVNKRDVNKLLDNVLSDIIKKGIKKQDILKAAESVVDDIIKQSSMSNITKEAPMVKALREAEGKPSKAKAGRKKPIASIASEAPTVSDSTTVNPSGSPRDISPMTYTELKSDSYKRLTEYLQAGKITDSQWNEYNKNIKDISGTGASARLNSFMDELLQQYGSGLRKRKSKKNK